MKVFVTGATGFVGHHVAKALAADGAQLRMLVRKTSKLSNLEGIDGETHLGNLAEPESIRPALSGCDAVVHVAADYRLWIPNPDEMYRANVDGTRDLLRMAREAGVKLAVDSGEGFMDPASQIRQIENAMSRGADALLINPADPDGLVASIEYLAALDESATGTRRERLSVSMQSAATYLNGLFDYLLMALRSLPLVMVIGQPEQRIPVMSLAVHGVPAERVVQRLADNGVLAVCNTTSRVLDAIGVNDIGGAVTIGLSHYSTVSELDQLVRALASLG